MTARERSAILIRQRVRDAERAYVHGEPGYLPLVPLQVAVEEYIELCWIEAGLGWMDRSHQPHRDRLAAAETLARCGFSSDDLPCVTRQLQELARSRYTSAEPTRSTARLMIERVTSLLADFLGPPGQLRGAA